MASALEEYNAFYGRRGDSALSAQVTDNRWNAFLAPEQPMWALLACRDSLDSQPRANAVDVKRPLCLAVGLAHYLFHHSTTSLAPACYMQDLFTERQERGRGIGAALIDAVAANARLAGCTSIYWQTHRTNKVAMRLYDRVAERSEFMIYRKQLG